MKWTPMLFQEPMVLGLLDDSKTNTRREVKPQPQVHKSGWLEGEWLSKPMGGLALPTLQDITMHCPYGVAGDRIWVKETFYAWGYWVLRENPKKGRNEWHFVDKTQVEGIKYRYLAGELPIGKLKREQNAGYGWWKRPAIFMPRAASRITLEVQRLAVERLHDISEQDAIAEGIRRYRGPLRWVRFMDAITGEPSHESAGGAYAALWRGINGAKSWDDNPYVWSIHFRRLP